MLKMMVSRVSHNMAAVCLLRPVCSLGSCYHPVPVYACTKLVAASRLLPWVGATLSCRGVATGVRIVDTATRRGDSARPLRLR